MSSNIMNIGKAPKLRNFVVKELELRGIDRHSRNMKEICTEIQDVMITYHSQFENDNNRY
jgi:hypothetical protein